jgi:protoporphyrinogen oxidase
MTTKQAVIIGGGPAGLTAAYELLERTDIAPLVLEMDDCVGGIARTVNYKGNRLDVGPHRFFSKSDRVMEWWLKQIPLQKLPSGATIAYHGQYAQLDAQAVAPDPDTTERVMLVCRRKTRIYFLRKFFDYPLQLSGATVAKLGLLRTAKIAMSYGWAALTANRRPQNLEEFFISRFGRELYLTFFKSYTEKVWGESCSQISAEWGAQRIKGLSVAKAFQHFLASLFGRRRARKTTETSLVEEFLFPKRGPGQMWGTVAEDVTRRGGKVLLCQRVTRLHVEGDRITAVDAVDAQSGEVTTYPADYVFSTMPVTELVDALDADVPEPVREVTRGLVYRNSIVVGMLLKDLKVREKDGHGTRPISDNWIYIQEPDVKMGRLEIFNNWGGDMVADPKTTWLGVEYFCRDSDDLWHLSDEELKDLAKVELARIGFIDAKDVLDGTVLRMPKTYPAYFGTYPRFGEVRAFADRFSNLLLIGRNGMHKYNNMDHSMLTAMTAVDNLVAGRTDKANIWDVNTEEEYHEAK